MAKLLHPNEGFRYPAKSNCLSVDCCRVKSPDRPYEGPVQVWSMQEKGVQAGYVGDAQDEDTVADICGGKYQIIFISPESLLTDDTWRDMLQSPMYKLDCG